MFVEDRLKRWALITASIFLLIVGVLLNVSQLQLMAIALSLIQPIFWVVGMILLRGLRCERVVPQTCGEGERVRVGLVIHNAGRLPKFFLRAADQLPRWVRFAGHGDDQGAMLLNLWPGETDRLTYFIEPRKRGLHQIGPTRVLSTDLIGMNRFVRILNAPDEILVHPEVIPVRPEFLSSGAERGWRDQENAPGRGQGTDFHGVRDYRHGDDLRRVNWKTTARTGALAVTEYSLGYANDIVIALDLAEAAYRDSGEGADGAVEAAIKIAASLASATLGQGSAVRFMTNLPIDGLPDSLRGGEQLPVLLDALARAEATATTELADEIRNAANMGKNDGMLVCITPVGLDDMNLQNALSFWEQATRSGTPFLFLLDRRAFGDAWEHRFEPHSTDEYATAFIRNTSQGREFHIGPGCNLAEMFERVGGR